MTSDLLRSLVSSRDALTFTSDHLLAGGLRARLESGLLLRRQDLSEVIPMMDVLFVVVTLLFFFVSWLYVRACDRV